MFNMMIVSAFLAKFDRKKSSRNFYVPLSINPNNRVFHIRSQSSFPPNIERVVFFGGAKKSATSNCLTTDGNILWNDGRTKSHSTTRLIHEMNLMSHNLMKATGIPAGMLTTVYGHSGLGKSQAFSTLMSQTNMRGTIYMDIDKALGLDMTGVIVRSNPKKKIKYFSPEGLNKSFKSFIYKR